MHLSTQTCSLADVIRDASHVEVYVCGEHVDADGNEARGWTRLPHHGDFVESREEAGPQWRIRPCDLGDEWDDSELLLWQELRALIYEVGVIPIPNDNGLVTYDDGESATDGTGMGVFTFGLNFLAYFPDERVYRPLNADELLPEHAAWGSRPTNPTSQPNPIGDQP